MNVGGTIFDYFDDPVIVFDQPERIRDRCENRFLEFKEMYVAALEHGDALSFQSDLLFEYDHLLARADGRSVLITNPFLRTEKDFHPQVLFQVESRNATGYQGNIKELAIDIERWKQAGWRVALLAGGAARSERLLQALKNQECAAKIAEETDSPIENSEVNI